MAFPLCSHTHTHKKNNFYFFSRHCFESVQELKMSSSKSYRFHFLPTRTQCIIFFGEKTEGKNLIRTINLNIIINWIELWIILKRNTDRRGLSRQTLYSSQNKSSFVFTKVWCYSLHSIRFISQDMQCWWWWWWPFNIDKIHLSTR